MLATHALERALALADRVAILSGGRIAYSAPTADLTLADLRATYRGVASADA